MTEIKLPYFCCACEYEPENFDPENGDFDCPKCGCEIIVNESKVIQTITALRARIEELTIPADVLDTAIKALSTWNTQYPERYLAARYWLQAQKAKATRPEGGKE